LPLFSSSQLAVALGANGAAQLCEKNGEFPLAQFGRAPDNAIVSVVSVGDAIGRKTIFAKDKKLSVDVIVTIPDVPQSDGTVMTVNCEDSVKLRGAEASIDELSQAVTDIQGTPIQADETSAGKALTCAGVSAMFLKHVLESNGMV